MDHLDRPERLDALWSLLAERPCHLLIESGGSGGAHAYWKLAQPLPATVTGPGGDTVEPIERANQRLIHALGVDEHGRPDVADPRCAERSRVMRLAGTINHKTGAWARVIQADLALAPYTLEALLDGLPEPRRRRPRRGRAAPTTPPRTRTSRSRRPNTSCAWRASTCRAADSCAAPSRGMTTLTRRAASARTPRTAGAATAPRAARAARSTTSPPCCSAGRGGRRCAARRSRALRERVAEAFGPAHGAARPRAIAVAGPPVAEPDRAHSLTELWRVVVRDDVDARIAGHDGGDYTSPPQPRAQALALVALLLRGPVDDAAPPRKQAGR